MAFNEASTAVSPLARDLRRRSLDDCSLSQLDSFIKATVDSDAFDVKLTWEQWQAAIKHKLWSPHFETLFEFKNRCNYKGARNKVFMSHGLRKAQLKAFNPIFKRWGRLPQELLSDDLKPPAYTGSVLRELATLSCKDVHYERCQELLQEAVTARLNGMNLNGDQLARPNKTNAATHLIVTDIRSVIDFLDSENTYVRSISQEEMSNYETSMTEEERRADVQQTGMMTRYKKKRATREVVINFFEDESRPDRTPAIGERHCGVQEAEDSDGELEGRPKSAIKRQKLLDEGRVESVTQHHEKRAKHVHSPLPRTSGNILAETPSTGRGRRDSKPTLSYDFDLSGGSLYENSLSRIPADMDNDPGISQTNDISPSLIAARNDLSELISGIESSEPRIIGGHIVYDEQLSALIGGEMLASSIVMAVLTLSLQNTQSVLLIDSLELSKFDPQGVWASKASTKTCSTPPSTSRGSRALLARLIILPVYHDSQQHWTLCTVTKDNLSFIIRHFNSMPDTDSSTASKAFTTVEAYLRWLFPENLYGKVMSQRREKSCAQQTGVDCGIYMIANAIASAKGQPLSSHIDATARRKWYWGLLHRPTQQIRNPSGDAGDIEAAIRDRKDALSFLEGRHSTIVALRRVTHNVFKKEQQWLHVQKDRIRQIEAGFTRLEEPRKAIESIPVMTEDPEDVALSHLLSHLQSQFQDAITMLKTTHADRTKVLKRHRDLRTLIVRSHWRQCLECYRLQTAQQSLAERTQAFKQEVKEFLAGLEQKRVDLLAEEESLRLACE